MVTTTKVNFLEAFALPDMNWDHQAATDAFKINEVRYCLSY